MATASPTPKEFRCIIINKRKTVEAQLKAIKWDVPLEPKDIVRVHCSRDNIVKTAYAGLLEETSEVLKKRVRASYVELGLPRDANQSVEITCNMTSELLDVLLNYCYSNLPISVPARLALQMYAAGNRLRIKGITDPLRDFITTHTYHCLYHPTFLDTPADDVKFLDQIFYCERSVKKRFYLRYRITEWKERRNNSDHIGERLLWFLSTQDLLKDPRFKEKAKLYRTADSPKKKENNSSTKTTTANNSTNGEEVYTID